MNKGYHVLWGGDPGECGIWYGDTLVVSDWELRRYFKTDSYDVCYYFGADEKKLAWYHKELERKRGD